MTHLDRAMSECFAAHRRASARITLWCCALSALVILAAVAWAKVAA